MNYTIIEKIKTAWEPVREVWGREYRRIFHDKGILLVFFVAFIIYPVFYPLPYLNEMLREVPIAVVDMDNTKTSRQLARMLDANECLKVTLKTADMEEAKNKFFREDVYGIVLIPADFDLKIVRKEIADLVLYSDASYFLTYRQILTGTRTVAGTMAAGVQISRLMASGMTNENAIALRDPLPLISYPLFNPGGGYAGFVVPAVFILILQQTLLIGIGMLIGTERETGSLNNLLTVHTGNKRALSVLLGKTGAYFSIYFFHVIYIYEILYRIYNFPQRGNIFLLLFFAVPFLLACIFLGFSVCSFFKNRETSMTVLLCTSIPALFLSGFSWPSQSIPEWLHIFSYVIPSTAGVDGFLKINQMGASFRHVSSNWLILWGLVLIYSLTAFFSIRGILSKERRATVNSGSLESI